MSLPITEGRACAASRVHEECINVKGWTVRARTAPIIGSSLMDQYSEQLGGVLTLPEILFGNSSLQLRHDASGVVLSFTALDALKQWKEDDLPPLKVQVAQTWQAARQQEITKQQAIILEYDWTYTTSYTGSVSWSPPQFASSPSAAAPGVVPAAVSYGATQGNSACKAAVPSLAAAAAAADTSTAHLEHQALSALSALSTAQPKSAAAALQQPDSESCISTTVSTSTSSSSSSKQLPQWHATTQQINRQMLMSKDEPILFYAEVPLYESELDDNGVCQLSVKVRVMPRCWLVLLRFWLRVDSCVVRLREVRHFCRLDDPQQRGTVIREVKHSEGTMQELAAAGAPTSVSGYENVDDATAVFNAISPQCLKTFELHEMVLPKRNVGNDLSQPQSEQHHPCKQQLLLQCQQDGHVLQDQKRC